ncbi:MAG: hypothetical protein ACO1O1_02915 [Adhaeribacter sp.]
MNFVFERVFEDEFLQIDLDAGLGLVKAVWLQHPDSDRYREGFSRAAEIVLQHNCRYWLSDSRQIHYLEIADQNWILHHMAPMMGNSCLSRFARVNSIEGLYLQDLDRVMQQLESSPHLKSDLEIAVFLDMEQSINWLFSSQPLPPAAIAQAPSLAFESLPEPASTAF